MRCYLVEDLLDADLKKIADTLDELQLRGPLDGIYYLPLPENLLQPEQTAHLDECGPFFMALELVEGASDMSECQVRLELLVRARNKIRCSCVAYATPDQRRHMIDYLDQFLNGLGIAA
ncbi:MAG: hypothetical protein H0S80_05570 [Desulfovibrionaceae bacterium]|nr:hypothetical protein [Desulfovibrionaceae bacterium]